MASPFTIQNQGLQVTFDDSNQEFTVATMPDAKVFISGGKLALSGTAMVGTEMDKKYGKGDAITITDAKGTIARLILFPKLPFLVIRETLKNAGSQEQILNKVPIVTFNSALDGPISQLKVRGTGGLSSGNSPGNGSYEWLAAADPASEHGIVAGWLSQFRATGVLFAHNNNSHLAFETRTEFGRLHLAPGQSAETETFAVGYFDDVRVGLETWADQVARTYNIHLPSQPSGYCTWYSDNHGGSSDEKSLAQLGDFISANLKSYGMDFVQIDDGWQLGDSHGNGSNKNFTAFNTQGPYRSGMKQTADHLKSDGLMPGIWFMAFSGTYKDDWYKDKQDLFVKHADGTPYDTSWGGTCLDMTNPAAREYVKAEVTRIAHDWGYTYFKLDGFWTGLASNQAYVNVDYRDEGFGDAIFFDPTKTNVEALRMGMKTVRDAAGPGVFILGCNTAQNMRTYGGSFGLLDAMRVGPDNSGSWGAWAGTSPVCGSRSYFLNGRVWYNDPDPNYVRTGMTLDEARTSASWTAIAGQLYTNSDWIPGLPPERLEIIKRTVLSHGKLARPVDFFENDPPRVWQVIDDKGSTRRDVVALYNWTNDPLKIDVPLTKFDLPKADQYAAFDFWANAFLPPVHDTLSSTLPPHSCQIIALRPMVNHPFVLSTSRHVTQGMIELTNEKWNSFTQTLSGTSQIIANDPYELRISVADSPGKWKISQVRMDLTSQAAGVKISPSNSNGIRAAITAPNGGSVSWQLVFNHVL
jgi:hypothetical protein